MSYPYPQDRNREQREKGEQPYKDAKESFRESEAEIQENANQEPDPGPDISDEEQTALQEQEAEKRFTEIGEEDDQEPSS